MSNNGSLDELTKDDLIVLFEWAHRFCETQKLAFSHPAEAIVIDKIAGNLERALAEPFQSDYPQILKTARERILGSYETQMGSAGTWIRELQLLQK